MVERGREWHGRTVFAPLEGRTIAAKIVPPVFYDPEGTHRDA